MEHHEIKGVPIYGCDKFVCKVKEESTIMGVNEHEYWNYCPFCMEEI